MDKSMDDLKKMDKTEIIALNSFIIVLICDNVFNITHWQNALTFFC